ncbi:MAG: family 20 glycosylhydrolase [Candidatus Binatia bacterium]|nr:family 20 glycosylhydrolase [Candidatus Binatia bacterium]
MNRGPVLLVAVVAVVAVMGGWVWWNLNPDAPLIDAADRERITVLPLPTDLALREGNLDLDDGLTVEFGGHTEPRLERAVERMRTRLPGAAGKEGGAALLTIDVGVAADESDPVWIDESYALDITPEGARLRAASPVGAIHGMQTFVQLVENDRDGVQVPAARIRDAPRFRWRGLMIDTCRHWIPKDVILRNLDAMEAAKLNVLHLHLTEDQAFRVESALHPLLHEVGSGGDYFTQDDLREIVAYAHDRGIRVVPEFDLPGHSLSWLEAYPELAIEPGPWTKANRYGIHSVALDPTRDEVYAFLDSFLGEMAGIFPDPYVHIGGDEAKADLWDANERVQAYQREHGLPDHRALQAHFNQRLHGILSGHGKRMMGWEEIRHEDLPRDAVVHAWLTPGSLAEAVKDGYETVLSQGYYLDHKNHASTHYAIDPLAVPEPVIIPTDGPWQSWEVTMETPAGEMELIMVVYGEGKDVKAVSALAIGGVLPLSDVRFEDGVLQAMADSPIGEMAVEATADGDEFVGGFSSLVMSAEFAGRRTGGHDVPGTAPPDLQKATDIAPEDRYRIFGGEAAMWAELVTAETIDSRIWPRTGAIAERLWSPAESTADVDDMYRRLDAFSERIDGLGVRHVAYREPMLEDIAGGPVPPALRTLVAVLEESKSYTRHRSFGETLTTETPLDRVADAAAPESATARRFSRDVDGLLVGDGSREKPIRALLALWRDQYAELMPLFASSPRVAAVEPLSRALSEASVVALASLDGDSATGAVVVELPDGLTLSSDGAVLGVGLSLRRLVEGT